jgi:hypothetical protein
MYPVISDYTLAVLAHLGLTLEAWQKTGCSQRGEGYGGSAVVETKRVKGREGKGILTVMSYKLPDQMSGEQRKPKPMSCQLVRYARRGQGRGQPGI